MAPDLSDDEDGEQKFSVQSFLVSPEELTLLKPSHTWTTTPHSKGELSIDAQMLRQLSEAGMTIGRQIETSAVDIVLQSTKDMQAVKKLAQKLGIDEDGEKVELLENLFAKIKSMVSVIQQKTENGVVLEHMLNGNGYSIGVSNGCTNGILNGCSNGYSNGFSNGLSNGYANSPTNTSIQQQNGMDPTMHLVNILSTAILKCVTTSTAPNGMCQSAKNRDKHPNNSSSLYELISEVLESNLAFDLGSVGAHGDTIDMATIGQMLSSPLALQALERQVNQLVDQTIQISKVDLIKSTISKNIYNDAEILKNICVALQQDEDMVEALRSLSESEPKLLYRIVGNMKADMELLVDDASTVSALKRSVILAVKESAINEINQMLLPASSEPASAHGKLNVVLMETAALAKALGLSDTSASLTAILGHADKAKKLLQDENIMELVQRVVVMKKMAAANEDLQQSLSILHTDPFSARKDPKIRQLLRRSGVCTIDPTDQVKLNDSNEVPISLFCSDNQLAMEDFLMRRQTKSRGRAFLIVKEGLQAVVPRESSRDVLTGKCAYTVLDENGIRQFEPLHVFSALKMDFPSAHRFSIYSCDVASDDMEVESVITATGSTISADVKGLTLFSEKEKSLTAATIDHTEFYNKRRLLELCANGKQVNLHLHSELPNSCRNKIIRSPGMS